VVLPAESGRPETAAEFARRVPGRFVLRGQRERKEGENLAETGVNRDEAMRSLRIDNVLCSANILRGVIDPSGVVVIGVDRP
jgi:hypothetical protein